MNLRIVPVDPHWLAAAERHQNCLTKPPGSLGRLETIANRCAAIFGSLTPPVDAARIVIFAADHGVAEEGVSAYPGEVTAQMEEGGRRVSGRGASTDVIEASAKAYLDGLNKLANLRPGRDQ